MQVLVALKYAASAVVVDPLTGSVSADDRSRGLSAADAAALEVALSIAGHVTAVTVGPPEAAQVLRSAWAAGADRLIRYPPGHREHAAAAIAQEARQADVVLCGGWSPDGGSGAVPALVAGVLGVAQALGSAAVRRSGESTLEVERRVDGGGLERLEIPIPAVVSVGAEVASLRRASLDRLLDSAAALIELRDAAAPSIPRLSPPASLPYRPRPKMTAAPDGVTAAARIRVILGETAETTGRVEIRGPAEEAIEKIHTKLAGWGYLGHRP